MAANEEEIIEESEAKGVIKCSKQHHGESGHVKIANQLPPSAAYQAAAISISIMAWRESSRRIT